MKKGMIGRTKKRLSKKNRGTRKVGGGRMEKIFGSLIGLIIILGLIGKSQFYRDGKIEVEAVQRIAKKYEADHETINKMFSGDAVARLPDKTKKALRNGLDVEELLKKSMEASKRREIREALAGPVQTAVENADKKDVDAVIEWLESLNDTKTVRKSETVAGIVNALNNVEHESRSHSADETRRSPSGTKDVETRRSRSSAKAAYVAHEAANLVNKG
jgi:hypothetical protein